MSNNRRGQVTLFIIVAIVLVAGIVSFMFIYLGRINVEQPIDVSPQDFVRSCVGDLVENSISDALFGGGLISPDNYVFYNGEPYNYLCYTDEDYQGCYNRFPGLEFIVEEQIHDNTIVGVRDCFNLAIADLEDRGYLVSDSGESSMEYSVDLVPGEVKINLRRDIAVSRESSARNFREFDFSVMSIIYNLIEISRGIINDESQYCNYDYTQYMLLYSNYDITKIDFNSNKIYMVGDRRTGDVFRFAIRTCPFPAGL